MRVLALSCLTVAAISVLTHAATRHVPAEYSTIQQAILASSHGDTVLVAEGTYVENINFRGRNIVVASHYLLDENVSHIHFTIIDGSQPAHSDTGSVVSIISGEDSTTALIGFTITGGTGTKFRDQDDNQFYVEGGGVIIENSNPLIAHNVIKHNSASRTVPGALSSGGGGIRYGYCAPTIRNNIILHNSGKYGGGIVSFFADGELYNNVVANNSGGQAYGGGGLWMGGAGHTTTLINNTIGGNESIQSGGGIRLFAGVLNGHGNIVWGNRASSGSQQVGGAAGNIHLDYCCVQGGFAGTDNINEYPLFDTQNLLLNANSPCVNTGHPDVPWNDDDGSRNDIGCYGGPSATIFPEFGEPAISIANDLLIFTFESPSHAILVANSGLAGLVFDSFAFTAQIELFEIVHYPADAAMPPFTSDSIVVLSQFVGGDVGGFDTLLVFHNDSSTPSPVHIPLFLDAVSTDDLPLLPKAFTLHPAFPNPFNPNTTIFFALPSDQFVSLVVTDIQGREVSQLLNKRLSAGEHAVEWNASSFASGTYFATLRAGNWRAQTKLTLLK